MSLIDLSLSGLSKPGTKLIEKVSDAIGILYEPRRIKKKAEADAEARKITALANIELAEIEQRAIERIIKQESRKQENIENITMQAAEQMKESDSIFDIDQDWIIHFFNECENISDKEMQTVWAKILTEQAKRPNTFSKRTINFLSSLDKKDAELITFFGQFVWQASIPTPILIDIDSKEIVESGMTYMILMHLESIGVITIGNGYYLHLESKKGIIGYFDERVELDFSNFDDSEKKQISTGTIILTTIGQEIIRICGATKNPKYFESCISYYEKQPNLKVRRLPSEFYTRF